MIAVKSRFNTSTTERLFLKITMTSYEILSSTCRKINGMKHMSITKHYHIQNGDHLLHLLTVSRFFLFFFLQIVMTRPVINRLGWLLVCSVVATKQQYNPCNMWHVHTRAFPDSTKSTPNASSGKTRCSSSTFCLGFKRYTVNIEYLIFLDRYMYFITQFTKYIP